MTAVVCECGHGKSDHVLLSRECRNPDPAAEDCVCTKFRPSTPPTAWKAPPGTSPGIADLAAELLGGESTSAALARVTAEPAEARQDVEIERTEVANLRAVQAERDKLRTELTDLASLAEGFRRTIAELTAERDEARAARSWMVARDGGRDCILCGHEIRRGEAYELNPGADELQHVHCPDVAPTAAPDQVLRAFELAEELRVKATAERDEARAELYRLSQVHSQVLDSRTPAEVVTAYDCLYCRTCYGRYFDGTDAANNHEHPLVPVQVTITLREGHR